MKQNYNDVKAADCMLCVGNEKCSICVLKTKFENELMLFDSSDLRRLDDIAEYLLHQVDRNDGLTADDSNIIPQIRIPSSIPVEDSDDELDKTEVTSVEQNKGPSVLLRLKESLKRRLWGRNVRAQRI